MNELSAHMSAQLAFMDAAFRYGRELAAALRACGHPVADQSSVRTLVRLARSLGLTAQLEAFETAVRAALVAYVQAAQAAAPKHPHVALTADAQFLLEHFDRFTEVPITASPVKRVVSWARRNYRRWREGHEGHEH